MTTKNTSLPNILFFFTDDQRFDTIRALGNSQIQTPNMDKLVERGTTFTHAHIPGGTCGAVCMPSRAMLHTGRTLFNIHGLGREVPQEHALMGETLNRAGYSTYSTGKWHNGYSAFNRSFEDGAEIFFGGMEDHWNVPANDYDPTGKYENTKHTSAGVHSTDLFCNSISEFLRGHDKEKPFFAYCSFMAPHDPRVMPSRFREMYNEDEIEIPENFMDEHPFDTGAIRIRDELLAAFPRTEKEIRTHIADYYAMITHIDEQMGNVLSILRERDMEENTIIVFAGDNGLAVGQHGLMGKQNCYEHSVRVPLIFAGPGIPQNKQCNDLVFLLDIFPTLCGLTGTEIPETVEGINLVPVMQGEAHGREHLYLAYQNFIRAVSDRNYKLIEYNVNNERHTQLFDLNADNWETKNLADNPQYKEELSRLRKIMAEYKTSWNDNQPELGESFWKNIEWIDQ